MVACHRAALRLWVWFWCVPAAITWARKTGHHGCSPVQCPLLPRRLVDDVDLWQVSVRVPAVVCTPVCTSRDSWFAGVLAGPTKQHAGCGGAQSELIPLTSPGTPNTLVGAASCCNPPASGTGEA